MTPPPTSATAAALVLAVDAGTADHAGAEHLLHRLDALLDGVAGLPGPSDLASTHVVPGPVAHTAVVLSWDGQARRGEEAQRLLAEALPDAGVVVAPTGSAAGPDDRVAGADHALAEHEERRAGRLARFPGQAEVERRIAVADVLTLSCVDAVEGLAGREVGPGTMLDLTGFVRPTWRDRWCVVLVQASAGDLVPFESRHQIPCCSDH
ncbi:hypothetical protein [Nocardioides lijunqiniae]|uniref:hypothetical protein n=1 Tax=Nocardioides lijunqiniae TaxID=2760832 RepID=UPI0018787756|nr:hypothetical protein [Nocardioides lijunqiniae]